MDGDVVEVSGKSGPKLSDEQRRKIKRIPSIDKAMDFYNLATTIKHLDEHSQIPDLDSFMATMIKEGEEKLEEARFGIPDAGGLVIAPDIESANHIAKIIEQVSSEKPVIVHSKEKNAQNRLKAYKNNQSKWLVSVAMVSEGVDIPRLRVLVYLPTAMTELFFRQAMGRVVRNYIPDDNSRAYVILPAYGTFEKYAERVEREMSPKFRKPTSEKPKKKVCPDCHAECEIGASECNECGYEFPVREPQYKICHHCEGMNLLSAEICQHCGEELTHNFGVTLDSALRDGVYVRGMELSEEETQLGEQMAQHVNDLILSSGDEILIKKIRSLPEESYGRLAKVLGIASENMNIAD
jgi:superfamily II DNA or RNA helicase